MLTRKPLLGRQSILWTKYISGWTEPIQAIQRGALMLTFTRLRCSRSLFNILFYHLFLRMYLSTLSLLFFFSFFLLYVLSAWYMCVWRLANTLPLRNLIYLVSYNISKCIEGKDRDRSIKYWILYLFQTIVPQYFFNL